jgi:hypothetical protein
MTSFADVQALLDASVGGEDIGAHGRFWRTLSRDEFVAFQVFGTIPLLTRKPDGTFDADESNLIKALQGRNPFGRDLGVPNARFPRMPARLPPMTSENIQLIRDWICKGCQA